jgi:hypothetical protein
LLATTIAAAVQMKAATTADFDRVIVGTTVRRRRLRIRPTAVCSVWRAPDSCNWRSAPRWT